MTNATSPTGTTKPAKATFEEDKHGRELWLTFSADGPASGLAGCGFESGAPAAEPIWERVTSAMLRRVNYCGPEADISVVIRVIGYLRAIDRDHAHVLRAFYSPGRWRTGIVAGDRNGPPLTRAELALGELHGVALACGFDLAAACQRYDDAEIARRAFMADPEVVRAERRYQRAIAARSAHEERATAIVAALAQAMGPRPGAKALRELRAAQAAQRRAHDAPWPRREKPVAAARVLDKAEDKRTKAEVDAAKAAWKAAVEDVKSRSGVALRRAQEAYAAVPRPTKKQEAADARRGASGLGEAELVQAMRARIRGERPALVATASAVAELLAAHVAAVTL